MVRVYFATNRAANDNVVPTRFGRDADLMAPDRVWLGFAEVNTRKREISTLVAQAGDAPGHNDPRILGSARFNAELEPAIDQRQTLIWLHGYAFTFTECLVRAAEIAEFYGTMHDLNMVVASWPSNGRVVPADNYLEDRIDAAAAGVAMAAALSHISGVVVGRSGTPPHLLAHSMGNFALRHALQKMLGAGAQARFRQVLLTAADEDWDALEDGGKLGPLPQFCERLTVYWNVGDTILMISDSFPKMPNRLGQRGPKRPARIDTSRTDLVQVAPAIIHKGDPNATTHQYFRNNVNVRADIGAVLAGQPGHSIAKRVADQPAGFYVLRPAFPSS